MNDNEKLPNDLSPINIKAYFQNALGACGCSELHTMVDVVKDLLDWCGVYKRIPYSLLYNSDGVYYLLVGRLDSLGLIEHGTSIRHPFLTEWGKKLLKALKETPIEDIENAEGEAYDGLWYGEF